MARLDLISSEKRFGAVDVLRDVNLSIADVEFIVLVGPSGCGKSTLLRVITGLEDISAGGFQIGASVCPACCGATSVSASRWAVS